MRSLPRDFSPCHRFTVRTSRRRCRVTIYLLGRAVVTFGRGRPVPRDARIVLRRGAATDERRASPVGRLEKFLSHPGTWRFSISRRTLFCIWTKLQSARDKGGRERHTHAARRKCKLCPSLHLSRLSFSVSVSFLFPSFLFLLF